MKEFCLAILAVCLPLGAVAQTEHDLRTYEKAKELYELGRLEETVGLLEENRESLSERYHTSALRFLALCCLEMDEEERAQAYVAQLLKGDPHYRVALNDPPRFADLVERLRRGGEMMVTTASQQAESLKEVPVPVTLITEKMIRQSGARQLSELLMLYVPGMSFVEGNEMNMAMHGVYSTLQEKILVMLDGHRLNSRTNNSEAFDFRTSLSKIKQIEVLRGPASSLYGNVALTAVVNIITKGGNDVDGLECSFGLGNHHTYRTDFTFGKKNSDLDFMGWASVYASEGERRWVDVEDDDFYGKVMEPGTMYINGFNHRPAYDIGFSLRSHGLKFLFSMQEAKRVNPYIPFILAGLYDYDRYRKCDGILPGHARRTTRLDFSYERRLGKNWWMRLGAFLDAENCNNYDVAGDTVPPPFRLFPSRPGEVVQPEGMEHVFDYGVFQSQTWSDYTYGGTVQTHGTFDWGGCNGSLLAGLQAEQYVLQDNKMLLGDHFQRIVTTYSSDNRCIENGRELNLSPFVQLKTKFSGRFIFNGGLRLDNKRRYDGEWLTVLSPRLSFIYNLSMAANVKLSYAHAFVDAPFFYRANRANTYPGGHSLKAEHNDAIQLSFEGAMADKRLIYQSNVFYNRLNDLIYRDIKQFNYANAGALDVMGLEQILFARLPRWSAYLNFTYQRVLSHTNYAATGAYVHHVPAFMLSGMFSYQLMDHRRWGRLGARAVVNVLSRQKSPVGSQVLFVGETRLDLPDHEVPARAVFNLGLDYALGDFGLRLDAYNLLNHHYVQGGDFPMPVPQQGLQVMTNISYKF